MLLHPIIDIIRQLLVLISHFSYKNIGQAPSSSIIYPFGQLEEI